MSEAKSTFKTIPSYVGDDPDKQEYSKLDEELPNDVPRPVTPKQVANGHADDTVLRCSQQPRTRRAGSATRCGWKSEQYGDFVLDHGAVIAAITSCHTSNPEVMLVALLARNAVDKGLACKPCGKTTMAPGSQVVNDYYDKSVCGRIWKSSASIWSATAAPPAWGLSGPLPNEISKAINDNNLRWPVL